MSDSDRFLVITLLFFIMAGVFDGKMGATFLTKLAFTCGTLYGLLFVLAFIMELVSGR